MRVLTGLYKGRVLRTVKGFSVRPATGRVRQTVFDMLAHRGALEGAVVLDLVAGSGSLGIESLSRGASHVTFVESDQEAVRYLMQNLRALGCDGNAEVVTMDALTYAGARRAPCDLVFADPPYRYPETAVLPEVLFRNGIVARGGILLVEHTTELVFGDTPSYHVDVEKRFGRTVVSFLVHNRRNSTSGEE